MEPDFISDLDTTLSNVGTDVHWKRKVGSLELWISPLSITGQEKVTAAVNKAELGTNIVGESKRVTLSNSIVGVNEKDLRSYRGGAPAFPSRTKEGKLVNVRLEEYLYSKMANWSAQYIDDVFAVYADLMETFSKENKFEMRYIQADLADRNARATLIEQAVKYFGRLDILVNAAGIQHRQPAMEFDLAKWDQVLSLMLTGVFELSQQAALVMDKQGGGKIVNIASVASFQGGWTIPAYAAAKHGVAGLTKALANEWASKNIHVNAIAPGYFDTDMCEAIIHDPVREVKIRERIPANRWGNPEDLVGPLLFLASDASNYVDGHILSVDGGWMGR